MVESIAAVPTVSSSASIAGSMGDCAGCCEGKVAEEGSGRSVVRTDAALFDCVLSSAALGAVLDVLRLAWWCALMVRPGGNVRQLAANVVYRASAVDIRGRRCSSAAAGGRERWVR